MIQGIEFLFLTLLKQGENAMPIIKCFLKDVLRKITMHCVLQAQSGDYVCSLFSRSCDSLNKAEVCERDLFVQQRLSKWLTCDFWLGSKFLLGRSFPSRRWGFSSFTFSPLLPSYCSAVFTHERIQYTLLFWRINHTNNNSLIGNTEHSIFLQIDNYKFRSCLLAYVVQRFLLVSFGNGKRQFEQCDRVFPLVSRLHFLVST